MSLLDREELANAQADLDGLLTVAQVQEGHMAARSGQRKGPTTQALENLRKTRVTFGQPRDSLVHLNPKLFTSLGINLDPIQQEKLKTENFYYMTIPVSMIPGDAVNYDQIKCRLEFGPQDENVAIVFSMFPEAHWKEVLKYGAELNVGLNADLTWGVGLGLDHPDIERLQKLLPAEVQGNVRNKNDYKGFIVIPAFSYSLGRPDIVATGVGSHFGYWDIQKPELKQTQTIKFGMIFKVPKKIKKVLLTGVTAAETSKNWLFSNLKPLFNSFSAAQRERVAKGIPLGDFVEWELKLPT